MLPVCNFAAVDSSQGESKKKGGKKPESSSVNLGQIKTFSALKASVAQDSISSTKIPNNVYVHLAGRGCYGLIRGRISGSKYSVRVPCERAKNEELK